MNSSFPVRLSRGCLTVEDHPVRTLRRACALIAALLLLGIMLPLGARAQTADPPAQVGRIAFTSGTVSFHANGQEQWTAAELNYPLTVGDAVWTEPGAYAVIEIGPASYRLGGGTELDAVQIDQHVARLRVTQGSVNLRLDALPSGDSYLIDTPRGTVALRETGLYRIDAGTADRPTHLVTFRGAAEFDGSDSSFVVQSGQAVDVSGDQTIAYNARPADQTPLDHWATARDAGPVVAAAPQYVSPQETGYQDLDHYGAWATAPDYGAVWYPTAVPVGWAPYRYGHWAWIPPWGWTWIDDAPWGFVPFHYGRWIVIHERWAWVPGTVVARPVYAPALVAFIGGNGWSVSIATSAVPAIGWVPLAPHEVFVPVYHASPTYITQVNITNVREVEIRKVVNVTNVTRVNEHVTFVNQQAATVVAHRDFVAARPVSKVALHADPAVLETASVVSRPDSAALPRPTPAVATPHGGPAPRPKPVSLPLTVQPSQPSRPEHAPSARTTQPSSAQPAPERHPVLPVTGQQPAQAVPQGVKPAPQPHPVPQVVTVPQHSQPQLQQTEPRREVHTPVPEHKPQRVEPPIQSGVRAPPPQSHSVPQVVTVPQHPQPQLQQAEPRREVHMPVPEHKPQRVEPPIQSGVRAPPPQSHPVPQAQLHRERGEQQKEEHRPKEQPPQ